MENSQFAIGQLEQKMEEDLKLSRKVRKAFYVGEQVVEQNYEVKEVKEEVTLGFKVQCSEESLPRILMFAEFIEKNFKRTTFSTRRKTSSIWSALADEDSDD